MNPAFRKCAALLVPLAVASCASGPKPTAQRGWIGGRFADVRRDDPWPWVRSSARERVVIGMPGRVEGDSAALVTAAYDDTPLARAGLLPGDLVLSLGGVPVENGLDLRERVEALAPGSHAELGYWRAGEKRAADVVVGRETYESAGMVQIGLALAPTLDLWPFDGDVDVLGLLRWRTDDDRNDLDGPVNAYRKEIDPDAAAAGPRQEAFEAFVLLVGFAKGKRVIRQETLP
jgi:hypothetical protein